VCRSAAEQSDAFAQVSLGIVYPTGAGLPKNYAETVKRWRKTADQGLTEAQYNLELLYGAGEGVSQEKPRLQSGYAYQQIRDLLYPNTISDECTHKDSVFRMTLFKRTYCSISWARRATEMLLHKEIPSPCG
jgi:TPR repeat protein